MKNPRILGKLAEISLLCFVYLPAALKYAGMFTYVWSYLRTYLILSSLKNQNVLQSSIYFLKTENLPV